MLIRLFTLCLLLVSCFTSAQERLSPLDTRLIKNKQSPSLLDAVGRLTIKRANGKKGICSGTLIKHQPEASKFVLTSAHCFKTSNESITWSTTVKGQLVERKAKLVHLSQEYDWALLWLDREINSDLIEPIMLFSYINDAFFPDADQSEEGAIYEYVNFDEHSDDHESIVDLLYWESGNVFIAGYSADAELGKSGARLTYEFAHNEYDSDEQTFDITYANSNYRFFSIQAFTFQGASGGPVLFQWFPYEEKDKAIYGTPTFLVGIIKGGISKDLVTSSNGSTGGKTTLFSGANHFTGQTIDLINQLN